MPGGVGALRQALRRADLTSVFGSAPVSMRGVLGPLITGKKCEYRRKLLFEMNSKR